MGKVKVAMIDDGIQDKYFRNSDNILHYRIKDCYVKQEKRQQFNDEICHGTTCMEIFDEFCNCYQMYSLRIMQSASEGAILENLLIALNWCMEHNIELINMSIGSININDGKSIERIMNKLVKRGLIIVAACSNNSRLTYPACLNNVIGVRCDIENKLAGGTFIYNVNPIDGIDITASYNNLNNEYMKEIQLCNSFATPFIAAKVCNYMNEGVRKLSDIKKRLSKEASYRNRDITYYINKRYKKRNQIFWQDKVELTNIVIINKSEINMSHLLNYLIKSFGKEGYNCVALKDKTIRMNFIKGLIYIANTYIENEHLIKDKIEMIYNLVNPDVMVTVTNNLKELMNLKEAELIDVLIYFDDEDIERENYKEICENRMKVNMKGKKNIDYGLYRKLINLLT